MSEATFGERLAEARRIKGETIEEVSDQLRIRPSIILAMETGNFSHMPHKGYTRNMVSSYARYLGLDSTHITEQFLREFRRWESSGGRRASGGGGSNASSLSKASSRSRNEMAEESSSYYSDDTRETVQRTGRHSVWNRGNARDVDREFRKHLGQAQDDQRPTPNERVRQVTPTTTSRRRQPNEPRGSVGGNDYHGRPPRTGAVAGLPARILGRPLFLIIGAVVFFLIILVLWAVFASTCSRNDTTNIPATGASDTATGLESGVGSNLPDIKEQIAEDNRYGPFELLVEVEGSPSWLLISVDGVDVVNEVMAPPWSQSWTVSTVGKVSAGAYTNVKVFRNGIEVPINAEEDPPSVEIKVEERPIVSNAQNADTANSTNPA